MLIDWFTVAAQALNFLVLAWLLKRFLYRPVLDAIDAREAEIARRIATAERAASDAQAQRADYEAKAAALDRERETCLAQARQDADRERQRLLEAARAQAQHLGERQRQLGEEEARRKQRLFAHRIQQETLATVRKLMLELADAELQAQILHKFLQGLQAMPAAQREALQGLAASESEVRIRTALALSAPQREALAAAVRELAARSAPVRFDEAPDLVAGIELRAGGWSYAWSVGQALDALQASARELLDSGVPPPPAPPAPEPPDGA